MSESFNQAADIHTLEKLTAQFQRTEKLFDDLQDTGAFKIAGRHKVLAFCCARCRLIWDELPPIAQQALQIAEQYNAGLVSEEEVAAQRTKLWDFWDTDPACRRGYGWSKTGEAVRAVLCCLPRPMDEPDNESVFWTMECCNSVKSGLEEVEYQMVLDYFSSGKNTNG